MVFVYQRTVGEADRQSPEREDSHVVHHGSSLDATQVLRDILGARDKRPRTAHAVGSAAERARLPEAVAARVDSRARAVDRRCAEYLDRGEQTNKATSGWRYVSRVSPPESGIEL